MKMIASQGGIGFQPVIAIGKLSPTSHTSIQLKSDASHRHDSQAGSLCHHTREPRHDS